LISKNEGLAAESYKGLLSSKLNHLGIKGMPIDKEEIHLQGLIEGKDVLTLICSLYGM
jgi:hypothetical protein